MSVLVVLDGGNVHLFSGLETPFNGWSSGSKSVTLTDEFGYCGVLIWLGHWNISVHSQILSECETVVSEPVLSIQGHIELCLLRLLVVKIPSWCLAMNGVNQVWITVLREWICNKLC